MYKTNEMRWFFSETIPSVEHWFKTMNLSLANAKQRTDSYLRLAHTVDLGVKLREGKIELKQRHGDSKSVFLANSVEGHMESWVKWGFGLSLADRVSSVADARKKRDWLTIHKTIVAVKLGMVDRRATHVFPVTKQIPYGCQIDYTRVEIMRKRWFTLGFEWFGDKHLSLSQELIEDITDNTRFAPAHSMSYPKFLSTKILRR